MDSTLCLRHIAPAQLPGQLAERFYRPEQLDSQDSLRAWCVEVEEAFFRQVADQSQGISHHIVTEAKRAVQDRAFQDITLTSVAKSLYVHPNYLSRLFKEQTGMNFSDYVISVKIEHAKELLAGTRLKSYEIAEQAGYLSIPHFNTMFKKIVGMTPKEYREQVCRQEERT